MYIYVCMHMSTLCMFVCMQVVSLCVYNLKVYMNINYLLYRENS